MQAELEKVLRQATIDWPTVHDYMCYKESLDPNMVDPSSKVATIHRAAYEGEDEVVKWCIAAGADVNERTAIWRVPLHYACNGNRVLCIKVLLQHGASINCRTLAGQTPLHACCIYSRYEATLELLGSACSELVMVDAEDSRRQIPEALTTHSQIKRAIRKYRESYDDRRKMSFMENALLSARRHTHPGKAKVLDPLPQALALLSRLRAEREREQEEEEEQNAGPGPVLLTPRVAAFKTRPVLMPAT